MFSSRTRRTMLVAVALSWLPGAASSQIKVSYASEAAVELTGSTGVTIGIEGTGFDRIRAVVVARDAAGRDVISEITGNYRGTAAAGSLMVALGRAAPPGTYFLFLTDGRELAPVPVELTVASPNEPPIVSGVLVDASAEPGQPFIVTVDAQDDRGLGGIEWEFAGRPGREVLPPTHVGYEQTSATLTFELTTDQMGRHILAVTVFDLDGLRSDAVEAFVTVQATTPPSGAPTIAGSPLVVVDNGTPWTFEWSAVAGAEEYQWYLTEIGPVMTDGNFTGTVSGLSASILRTPIDHTDYHFAVRAVNAGGLGPLSQNVQLDVRGQPLEQPTIISSYPAVDGQPDVAAGESFTFEWTPVPNATSYEYCLSEHIGNWDGVGSPSCNYTSLDERASVSTTSASFSRSGYPTRYYLTVRAKRNSRGGPYSELASIVVAAPPPVEAFTWEVLPGAGGPGAPRMLSHSGDWYGVGGSELHFEWEPVSGAYGYEYCLSFGVSSSCAGGSERVGNAVFSATLFVGMLSARCEFYFKVRTLDVQGAPGPWSDTIRGWPASGQVDQCG